MDRKVNRIKTALVDNGKTNKWLAEQLGKDPAIQLANGVQTPVCLLLR